MANGRPGDHPLNDILCYGESSYPADINDLVKELAMFPGFAKVRDRVAEILWDHWPSWQNANPDFVKVRRVLQEIERELKGEH